jgi:hypothetical protein
MNFFFKQLFGTSEGLRFMTLSCCCIFVGVQLMFEYRSVKANFLSFWQTGLNCLV